jgi:hypothetical protein
MRGISLLTMAMLGLLVAGAAPGSAPTAPPAAAAEASPVHLIVGRSPASDEEVEVVFQNVSADNLWIYLGGCDGGGFFPYQLTFTVREGDRVMKGHFFDPEHVNVGGRIDAYMVPLRFRLLLLLTHPLRPHDPLPGRCSGARVLAASRARAAASDSPHRGVGRPHNEDVPGYLARPPGVELPVPRAPAQLNRGGRR